MKQYPIEYVCFHVLGSGESTEEFSECINLDAALKKAKDDIKNKRWCKSVLFKNRDLLVEFITDGIYERSGCLEVKNLKNNSYYKHHIRDFLAVPLGQIDRGNIEVNLKCYWELSRLWSSDKNIIKSFLKYAESDYNNIADFMYDHCKFRKEWMDILRKYYGDFANMLDEEIREWCTDYFGGYYRIDFGEIFAEDYGSS